MTSWLTSALQTVRDKSTDALEFVRRDLTEFTSTVKNDTESYINKIKSQEVGDLGINRFVTKLNGTDKSEENSGIHGPPKPAFDRIHNEILRLQKDESTYLTDPIQTEAYDTWRQTTEFNVDAHKGEIAQLLIDAPHVRSFYAHLVPAQTTHVDFWSRYYFRLHQLEEEEARRTQLLRRAHEICAEANDNTAEDNANDWDEPEESSLEEPVKSREETVTVSVPIEHHEEQQETTHSNSSFEKSTNERSESDTGDSWEREFDDTDLASSPLPSTADVDPLIQSAETVTSDSLSSSTTTTTKTAAAVAAAATTEPSSLPKKKKENEFDDEWESWS